MELSAHWSYNLRQDPKRLAFVLARYAFAREMALARKARPSVLEMGCSEGIGSPLFRPVVSDYLGVDLDPPAIATAQKNFAATNMRFVEADFLGKTFGKFDAIVSLDVIEHIPADLEDKFLQTAMDNLADDGVCIVGTPNITSAPYASKASQIGHINLYAADRLKALLERGFHNVFLFGMNDECVHTAFAAMAHYLVVVGCHRRA
jgi:2-polyprenyl-3-methyl-5-hydroxy-6-metoxy-1,4-benzoquinol methylase